MFFLWNSHYGAVAGNNHEAPMSFFHDTLHSHKSENRHNETVHGNIHDAWNCFFDDNLHLDKSDCRLLLAQPIADEDFNTVTRNKRWSLVDGLELWSREEPVS